MSGADSDGWRLGVGKYLFETTTVSIDYAELDNAGPSDTSIYGISVAHLGRMGAQWQYAIDLAYRRVDFGRNVDRDDWRATMSFYPTRDFEFGVTFEDESSDSRTFGSFLDSTSYQGFASWFVTPNVEFSARYSSDDVGFVPSVILDLPTTQEADQESFGISATFRF